MVDKKIACVDCGVVFTVSAKNNKTCRCTECQKARDKENTRKRVQRFRADGEDVTVTIQDQKSEFS